MAAGIEVPRLPNFPDSPSPASESSSPSLMLPIPELPRSPGPSGGGSGGSGKGAKLRRVHTNCEPLGAMALRYNGHKASSSDDFLAPPMPIMVRKTSCESDVPMPCATRTDSDSTPALRRQLTPRVSWSTLRPASFDWEEGPLMSPTGRATSTRVRSYCPSPPPRGSASPGGTRSYALSPPPRPEKKSFGIIPPTPLANRTRSFEVSEGGNRFHEDFEQATVIGNGSFAVVYRARNKIDKQEYAIKKTKKTLGRSARRQEIMQEALALASVANDSSSPYIVRYFASWVEDERLFIQTELCDGSLKDCMLKLRQTRPADPRMEQEQLSFVIRDVCTGLSVLHGKNLVHLDVKPENILVKNLLPTPCRDPSMPSKIHKIADLGLATAAMGSGCDEINEGDSRYLAREVLQGNFSDLTKADVFSLGLTCYELATNPKELPCNGEEWHRLRDGCIENCFANQLSDTIMALIRCMAHPVAAERPPCDKVLEHDAISLLRPKELQINSVHELQSELRRQKETAEREQQQRSDAEKELQRQKETAEREQKARQEAEEKANLLQSQLLLLNFKRQAAPDHDMELAQPRKRQCQAPQRRVTA